MSDSQQPPLASLGTVRGIFAGPIRALRSPRAPGAEATAWKSAIVKAPVDGGVHVGAPGLVGDAQKDRTHHGGPTKAVLVYGASHYPQWQSELRAHMDAHHDALHAMSAEIDCATFGPGAFGENVLIDGLTEANVCLGDTWQIGKCVLQITEPRGPCGTLARRWMRPTLIAEVKANARAGWYNAVLQEGEVRDGDRATLIGRKTQTWTVERVFQLIEARVAARADVVALRDDACTHDGLRAKLNRRLDTPGRTHE